MESRLKNLRQLARELLADPERDLPALRRKVQRIAQQYDPNLRCAVPRQDSPELLAARLPLPEGQPAGTVIAADGSQINPDRHAEASYCLINVGAIVMQPGTAEPPVTHITSRLIYGDQLYSRGNPLTVNTVALMRDLNERHILAELSAAPSAHPVITFTDGPLELWGSKDLEIKSTFQEHLQDYHAALRQLQQQGTITAGYVDRPAANLVVRLLEVALTPEEELENFAEQHPLGRVSDLDLYAALLQPGERSAVFAIQSNSARHYREELALYFFYLNVSARKPKIARVEIPGWVAGSPDMVAALHAALYRQCQILGGRAYPYILHRAHEVAVVTLDERDQVTQMIVQELRRRELAVDEKSPKQSLKELPGRRSY
jgi:hypothetical protein